MLDHQQDKAQTPYSPLWSHSTSPARCLAALHTSLRMQQLRTAFSSLKIPWCFTHPHLWLCLSLLLTFLPLVILLLLRLCSVCSRMPSLISLAHSATAISDCLLIFLCGLHGVLCAYLYGRILSTLLNSFLSSLSGGSLFCFSLYSSCLIRLLKSS